MMTLNLNQMFLFISKNLVTLILTVMFQMWKTMNLLLPLLGSNVLKIGDPCQIYIGKSSSGIYYVGIIIKVYNCLDFDVKFLRKN